MRIRAWLPQVAQAAILGDALLASWHWRFCGPAEPVESGPELIVADLAWAAMDVLPEAPATGGAWIFLSGRASPWLSSPDAHFLPGAFDLEILRNRLLAWAWLRGRICPLLFGGRPCQIINGSLSLSRFAERIAPAAWSWDAAVQPVLPTGGDIVLRVDTPERTWLALADASGHGESAALDAALLMLALSQSGLDMALGAALLGDVNRFLHRHSGEGRYVAAIIIEIDRRGRLRLFNAAMPDALIRAASGAWQRLRSAAPPLGLRPEWPEAAATQLSAPSGTEVWAHSDGVPEGALPFSSSRRDVSVMRRALLDSHGDDMSFLRLVFPDA
ncbi:hypothetical protein CEK28_11700 [Xenophilus sp. AP218F]|nr:hypothetical protein CEK28_11700 [Xenophilus sp. AP218F]